MIRSLMHGDLYKNWEKLLRVTQVTNRDEGIIEKKKWVYLANNLIILHVIFSIFRLFVAGFLDMSYAHVWGYVFVHTGNARHMLGAIGSIFMAESAFYRMGVMQLVHTDKMYILRILRAVVSCPKDIRDKKEKQAHIILMSAVVGMVNTITTCVIIIFLMLVINIKYSNSVLEIICWILWWPMDVIYCIHMTVDLLMFPCVWLLVALNYRTDLCILIERIDEMKNQSNEIASTAIFREVYLTYFRIKAKADLTNRMSAPILWSLTFCTTPAVCVEAFVAVYSDNPLFQIGLFALFTSALLLMAADITSLAEQVHTGLCCTSARIQKKWTLKQRLLMLSLVQDAGSVDTPLAMYTTTGDKYTSESLLYYTLETVLNYLMLVTLKNSVLA